VEGKVRWYGYLGRAAAQGARGREREAEGAAAEAMLDNAVLKDIAAKSVWPAARADPGNRGEASCGLVVTNAIHDLVVESRDTLVETRHWVYISMTRSRIRALTGSPPF
jgi:hypothetical protein